MPENGMADDLAPSAEQGREDVRAAWQAYMLVLNSADLLPSALPGRQMALVLFNSGAHKAWTTQRQALAMLCGARNSARWAEGPKNPNFPLRMVEYITAFCDEFRRADETLRAGGRRREEMTEHLWGHVAEEATNEWVQAFASFENSGFEYELGLRPTRR